VSLSLIICSAGRPDSLLRTLESLKSVERPDGHCELILIENNPESSYGSLIPDLPGWQVRHIHEPTRGLSVARNRGLKEASGEIIAFTDDDLRFEPDWLKRLVAPLGHGVDAVAGAVRIPKELEEPWMEPWHRIAFASTEHISMEQPKAVVGANFAIHRRVLEKVPAFDEELGAGRLGVGEETLFAEQLLEAGYAITGTPDAVVWHHFDPSRKTRESFIRASEAWGRSNAYIDFKRGIRISLPGLRLLKAKLQLALHRRKPRGPGPMDVLESTLIKHCAYLAAMKSYQ
jgi:glucosyl-dolichyl phosphate glucuronosyltransferase